MFLLETRNPQMKKVYELAKKVAPSSSTILILGESGTGKEVLAKYIHFCSKRKGPFVPINCAAIPEELLEAELFGYEKGAFTGAIKSKPGKFELANQGTIFLDEIGDLSPKLQAKLLRVIQEKQVERLGGNKPIKIEVRILAATNKDLEKEVKEGKFREDLFFRLNVIPIRLPPLRERKEDIPLLVKFFLKRLCEREGIEEKTITPEALEKLINYPWPGNIRELENLIERLVILSENNTIGVEDLSISSLDLKFPIETRNLQMKKGYELAKKVAPSSSTILILGESGTGKEVLAKYIHSCSKRKGPFVPINCAAIPEELLEAELFGYEKGAFTGAIKSKPGKFELANQGTIFLDEIGDLSPKLQAKLLRVIQEKQVERLGGNKPIKIEVRILAATDKDLKKEVKERKFREDLFFRLNVIPIKLTLRNGSIEKRDIWTEHTLPEISEEGIELNKLLREIEIYYLKKALEISKGSKTKAAKLLGLNRTTFIEKLKKYNLV